MKYALILMAICGSAFAYTDARVCGEPVRDPDGPIHRSATLLAHFKQVHPCPSTGLRYGACPGWALDHVIPLDCGGCDAMENLQWLKNSIKSCAGLECKDRWERKVYAPDVQTAGTANCHREIVK